MTEELNHNPLTQFLARLTKTEQLQLMMTHPFFTGCCPSCGHEFTTVETRPLHWDCGHCGWVDEAGINAGQSLPHSLSEAGEAAQPKLLGAFLVEAGLLTQAQVDLALAEQAVSGGRLGEIFIKLGFIQKQTLEDFIQAEVQPVPSLLSAASG